MKANWIFIVGLAFGILLAGCGEGGKSSATTDSKGGPASSASNSGQASGSVQVDGSSTVFPVSEAVASEFKKSKPDVQVSVSQSGTGSGMQKFLRGEIDICDASRPIEAKEVETANSSNFEFVELPIAFDGLSIVVNKDNSFASDITVAELKKIWEPDSKVMLWSDVRPNWPKEKIVLFGPTPNHGTFEYFTEAINGKKKASRTDYTQCPDYNVLVQGVARDKNALGYVGFAYYDQNKSQLKALKVDSGKGPIEPSVDTIAKNVYTPLSRPLFIYVSKSSLARPEVKAFVDFYLGEGRAQVAKTGYVPLSDADFDLVKKRAEAMTAGSLFAEAKPGMSLAEIMGKEGGK